MTSKLLFDEEPLLVNPSLATLIGLHEAIVLQQLHYWLRKSKHEHDERRWIYNTYEEWQAQFPFMNRRKLLRVMKNLVEGGFVVVHQFTKSDWDRTNWYSIDYEAVENLVENMRQITADCEEIRRRIASNRRSRRCQIVTIENDTVA